MAEWKKVVVSGSSAELSNLDVDLAVTASFFKGDGSALTGIVADGSVSASSQIDGTAIQNNAITIAGTSTQLGGSITAATILGSTGVFSGSAQVDGTSITNNAITIAGASTQLGGSITAATIGDAIGAFSSSAQVTNIANSQIAAGAAIDISKINLVGSGLQSGSGDIEGVTAGDGLSGGGTTGTVSLALDLNELTAATVNVANDSIAIIDADDNSSKKESVADLVSGIVGDGLTATNGVAAVGAGTHVTVNANDVAVDANSVRDAISGSIFTTVSGDGTIDAGGVLTVVASGVGAGSVTNAALADDSVGVGELSASVAGTGLAGGSGTALSLDLSEYSDVVPANGDKLLTLDSDGSTEQLTTVAALANLFAGTGLSDTNSVISVDFGTGAGQAAAGATSVTFAGTSNEIELSTNTFTQIGGGGNVTIGLPDDVTVAGTLTAATGSISSDLSVAGNLSVGGDLTYINSTDLVVEDPFILLNSGSNGSTQGDSGIIFGGADDVANSGNLLFWDKDYNSGDGRLRIKNGFAHDTTGNIASPDYSIAGVFEGSAADAATAEADHVGNIRVESNEIYIYV